MELSLRYGLPYFKLLVKISFELVVIYMHQNYLQLGPLW